MTDQEKFTLAWQIFVGFILSLIVAWQARQRGYSLLLWTTAGMLSSNPIFLLILLGVMPDFARRKLREKELNDLDGRLAKKVKVLPRVVTEVTETQPYMPAITRTASTDVQRSIGDDETRL